MESSMSGLSGKKAGRNMSKTGTNRRATTISLFEAAKDGRGGGL